ncbi:MAG: VanW family protein [Alicyclobacillus sp.]|nr:VanW family protein [Alicyclobacillus sp.]
MTNWAGTLTSIALAFQTWAGLPVADAAQKSSEQPAVFSSAAVTPAGAPGHGEARAGRPNLQVPEHLYLPPNPPAPGRAVAASHHAIHLLAQRTTNYRHASPSQCRNIELVAKRLNGTVIPPGAVFSYNRKLGPYTAENGYHWGRAFAGDRIIPSMGGGVCQGASTLYSALLRTDLQVVERHPHGLTVPYLPAGEDATVSWSSGLDFRFRNTERTPVVIGAQAYPREKVLTIAVWGAPSPAAVSVHHAILAVYPYRTEYRAPSPDHPPGTVVFPGQAGAKVRTWVETRTSAGIRRRDIGTDTYRSSPRVVVRTTAAGAGDANRGSTGGHGGPSTPSKPTNKR